MACQYLAKAVADGVVSKRGGQRRVGVAVIRQAGKIREFWHVARKAGERGVSQCAGYFAGAVGTKVHEHHGVTVFHRRAVTDDGGRNKFIVFTAGIGGFERATGGVREVFSRGFNHRVMGAGHTIPALVAIHRVKAPAHCCYFCAGFFADGLHCGD